MPALSNIKEVRFLSGTTFNQNFTAADDAAWAAGTATKLRVQSIDISDLKGESAVDASIQTRLYARPANIFTKRSGSIKLSTFFEGANADETTNPIATLLSKICGGLQACSDRTVTAGNGSTTTSIVATGHGLVVGQGVLLGVRDDTKGNGEMRIVASVPDADTFTVHMATLGALTSGDAITPATSVYLDEDATQSYLDFLVIGKDTVDQVQTIGGMGTFKVKGLGVGEIPSFDFDIGVGDWREVQSNRASMAHTTAYSGNRPAIDRGQGGFFIGNVGSTTRATMQVTEVDIDPGVKYEAIPDRTSNGIGGWIKVPSSPTMSFTAMISSATMPGLYNDFAATAPQAKHVLVQFGHAAQRCAGIYLPRYFVDAAPTRKAIGSLAGVAISGHGDENATITTDLLASAISFHFC